MTLNMVIGYWVQVIKTKKFAADPHVENIEEMHLDLGERAPDVQIVIEFGKNEGRGQKGPCVEQKMLGKKDMPGQGNEGGIAFTNTVLNVCIRFEVRSGVVT